MSNDTAEPALPPTSPAARACAMVALGTIGLLVAAVGVISLFGYLFLGDALEGFRREEPLEFPIPELAEAPREDLFQRLSAFGEALDAPGGQRTLRLSGPELNYLVHLRPELRVFEKELLLELRNDTMYGVVSLPLDQFGFRGFLNGRAELRLELNDGYPRLYIADFTVDGERVPDEVFEVISDINLAELLASDPEFNHVLGNLADVRVEGNELVLQLVEDLVMGEGEGETEGAVEGQASGNATPPDSEADEAAAAN